MTGRTAWTRPLLIIGTLGLVVGTIDPLEGSVLIVAGVALITLAAFLGGSRHRRLLASSLVILGAGVAGMWIISGYGGVGETPGGRCGGWFQSWCLTSSAGCWPSWELCDCSGKPSAAGCNRAASLMRTEARVVVR